MAHSVRAQKWRLVSEVQLLAEQLRRPVCSADLRQHFRDYPDRHPLLLQRMGQLLSKAARKRPERAIWPVGVIGFFGYYAPDSGADWHHRLEIHRIKMAAQKQITEEFPRHIGVLLDTPYEALGRNALAGYVREFEAIVRDSRLEEWEPLPALGKMVEEAKFAASQRFAAKAPKDLIDRASAAEILKREYAERVDPIGELSVKRHLARLSWPQSTLFAPPLHQRFSEMQVRWYAAGQWPNDPFEGETAWALWLALRYGIVRKHVIRPAVR